jgi:hypothetical protein
VGRLYLAFDGFVVLLRIGVEVLDFEEVNFEDVFVQSELVLNERHNGGRSIEQYLIIPADESGLSVD